MAVGGGHEKESKKKKRKKGLQKEIKKVVKSNHPNG